jgi:signal transduction histidine kinase
MLRARELQASQAILRGVLDSAQSGIVAAEAMREPDGRIVDFRFTLANPMSEKMLFHTAEEMVGNTLLTLFPGNVESGLFDQYCRVTETGVPANVEVQYRDERLNFWLHVSAVRVGDGVAITFTDISDRKRAEQEAVERTREIATQKAFAEGIIEHVPTGITYLDRDLVYRVANPVYAQFLQMPREQIIGRYLFDVVPGGEDTILPIFRRAIDHGEPHFVHALSFEYFTPEGKRRQTYWDAAYLPMFGPDGTVEGVLVLANEVSTRIENELLQGERIQMLEETDRMKDQFLSILSHELRTPVNAIMGFGSILDDELPGPLNAEQRKYTGRILGGAETLLALINDLLDMSRIQAGKFTLEPRSVAAPSIAGEVIDNLRPLAERKRQTLELAVDGHVPELPADPQRLMQVLVNLIGNAIKFTGEGGRIALRMGVVDEALRVAVSDTGIGIAAPDISRLFRPFTQLDSSNTRSANGTGLGLSIAKALVEAHGGAIGVDSAPGVGSTFWFTLPLQAQGQAVG